MNKKIAVISFILLISAVAAIAGLKAVSRSYASKSELFEDLKNVTELNVGNSMTIVRHNGIWSSQDDDLYPVDNAKVENLLEQLRQAALTPSSCEDEPSGTPDIVLKSSAEIKLFYPDGENPAEQTVVVSDGRCVLLTGNFDIPAQPYQWFVQPLFPFSDDDIEEIYGAEPGYFSFSDLVFYQAAHEGDFTDWDQKKITVITTGGIIFEITLYARGHSYWASVVLKETPMPTVEAAAYIKNNGFLYDGWYFELPQPEGSRLFNDDNYNS